MSLELKEHVYFNGIDWDEVAKRNFKPPFEPLEVNEGSCDLSPVEEMGWTNLLKALDTEGPLDPVLAERFSSKFDSNQIKSFDPLDGKNVIFFLLKHFE